MVEPNRTEAVVEFDYVAHESDELTLRKGDVITDIRIQSGGWWEGCLGGKRGMFPDNFVRVLSEQISKKEPLLDNVPLRTTGGRRCKVLFSYQPANDDELALQVNDVIDVVGEVEEGWWKGKLRDMVGVFPSNFVLEIKDPSADENHSPGTMSSSQKSRCSSREDASESDGELSTSVSSPDSSQLLDSVGKSDHDADAPVLPPKPVKELCRALFPYDAANEDELTLKEGDLITLLSKEVADKGWWRGELRGRVGVFPDNFVELVLQDEQPKKPERPPAKSQLATTNRIRDTITKPTTTPTMVGRSESVEAAVRKMPEMPPRPDDRTSNTVPPMPGKKPTLPPPIKKPQRMGHLGSSGGGHQFDLVDGAGPSRSSRASYNLGGSRGSICKDEVPEFDSVERNAMLIHPTASRAKAPRRRPPTTIYNKETEVSAGLMNGSADAGHHNDLDNHYDHLEMEGGKDSGGGGPRGRVWEKNKVPWVEELKLNQAKKTTMPGNRSSLSPRSPTLLQPSPPVTSSRSPGTSAVTPAEPKPTPSLKEKLHPEQGELLGSVSPRSPTPLQPSAPVTSSRSPITTAATPAVEQKPTSSPKEKLQPEQGHSRLTSPQINTTTNTPPSAVSSEPAIVVPAHLSEATPKQTPTGVTLRHHGPPRAQSMYSGDLTRPMARPFSMSAGLSIDQAHPPPSSTTTTELSNSRTPPGLLKPSSIISPPIISQTIANRAPSPSLYSSIPASSVKSDTTHSPSSTTDPDVLSSSPATASTFPSPGSTVPHKQYLELKDKVIKLEQSLEQQKQFFAQALKEVTDKLNNEISRRIQIEQDLDKLTNLVTQV